MSKVSVSPSGASTGGVATDAYTGVAGGVSTRPSLGAYSQALTGTSMGASTPPEVTTEAVTGATVTSALLVQQLPLLQKFLGESHGD